MGIILGILGALALLALIGVIIASAVDDDLGA